jgi:hypothetical protein
MWPNRYQHTDKRPLLAGGPKVLFPRGRRPLPVSAFRPRRGALRHRFVPNAIIAITTGNNRKGLR